MIVILANPKIRFGCVLHAFPPLIKLLPIALQDLESLNSFQLLFHPNHQLEHSIYLFLILFHKSSYLSLLIIPLSFEDPILN